MPKAKTYRAVEFLDLLLEFFADGTRWTQRVVSNRAGQRCLVGAIAYVHHKHKISAVGAETALRQALPPSPTGRPNLAAFNDTRSSFDEIRTLILKARALALTTGPKQPEPTALRARERAQAELDANAPARHRGLSRSPQSRRLLGVVKVEPVFHPPHAAFQPVDAA